eukprot:s191_g28.t1
MPGVPGPMKTSLGRSNWWGIFRRFALWWCLLFCILPVQAEGSVLPEQMTTINAHFNGPSTVYEAQEMGVKSSLPGFLKQPSWTPEFLRYMNAVATANQFDAQNDDIVEDTMDDYGHVMVLTNHPGQRNWRLFRPDPQRTNRPSFLDIHATPDMALAEIQRRVLLCWPDLLGAAAWELVEISPLLDQSSQLPEDMEAFMLRADLDCQADEVVVMIESQTWRIAEGGYSTLLFPMVISNAQDPMLLPGLIGWQDHCSRVLCPVWVNGQTRRPTERIQDGDGSFIIISHAAEVDLISTITGHLTDFPGQFRMVLAHTETAELPVEFYRRVYTTMFPRIGHSFETVGFYVVNFQLALTDWYRWLYCYSGMRNIRRPMVALFHPSQPPGTPTIFMRLAVPQPVNVPSLYADLIDYDFINQEDWELVFMGHMIGDLALPQDVQYMGIAQFSDREQPLQLNLVLFEMHTADVDGAFRNPPTFVTLMVKESSSWFALLHMTGNLERCHVHWECVVQVDGIYALPHQQDVFVYDGSIVRIWMGDYFMEQNDTIQEVQSAQTLGALLGRAPQPSTSSRMRGSTSSQPYAPVSGVLHSMVMLLLFWLAPSVACRFRGVSPLRVRRKRVRRRRDGLRLRRCLLGFCRRLSRPPTSRKVTSTVMLFLCLSPHLNFGAFAQHSQGVPPFRYGEASHPGPTCFIGTSNPGGIRGKEMIYGQLPFGIWGISESQVAQPGLRAVKSAFSRASREYERDFHVLPGAMVPLRSRSETAGTWAGVMTVADLPLRSIQINWPHGEYVSGRAQLFEGQFGGLRLTGATVYGWPAGPAYPHALQYTSEMLETVVKELVLSRTGPRFLVGDFNHPEHKLPALAILRTHGWQEIQDLGFAQHGRMPIPTCKSSTTIDMVFVSPELIPYYQMTKSWPWFSDHVILGGEFDLPVCPIIQRSWPLAAKIPWDRVNWPTWSQQQVDCAELNSLNLDDAFTQFCQKYEASFNGHMDTPDGLLPSNCKGRGQRTSPIERPGALPLLRPSRQGELTQASDLLGRTPQKWFIQARRLQSMLHSVRAANPAATAQQYRAELWGAILRGRGFRSGFRAWWRNRPVQLQGSPGEIPLTIPSESMLTAIYNDFVHNYRKLESAPSS